jgi:hypothetical protein
LYCGDKACIIPLTLWTEHLGSATKSAMVLRVVMIVLLLRNRRRSGRRTCRI